MSEFSVGLPKWPAMVVVGDKVGEELAAELIIRCGYPEPMSNDRKFAAAVRKEYGFKFDQFGGDFDGRWADRDRVLDELGVLSLQYLHLDRVASCYIGGPHGWCDWDGNIGGPTCPSYNIGKWPSSKEVAEEWKMIAEAFPMLRLTCQLFDREWCEDHAVPVVQYDVKDGVVAVGKPRANLEIAGGETHDIFAEGAEQGCTIEKLRWAIELVRRKMKGD